MKLSINYKFISKKGILGTHEIIVLGAVFLCLSYAFNFDSYCNFETFFCKFVNEFETKLSHGIKLFSMAPQKYLLLNPWYFALFSWGRDILLGFMRGREDRPIIIYQRSIYTQNPNFGWIELKFEYF